MTLPNENNHDVGWVDGDGFYDLECRKCGASLFVIQANIDAPRLRFICTECNEELDIEYLDFKIKGEDSDFTNKHEEKNK